MALTASQQQDIQEAQDQTKPTRRAVVADLESILYDSIPVLDHGFVRVVDYMGDDAAVVQAARVSYGKGTRKVSQDRGLIRYLMRHRHSTPFEMCEIKLHVKLPVFVARQWIRHRTANVNEYSARYSIIDNEFYLPQPQHLAVQSQTNNQGRDKPLDAKRAAHVLAVLKEDSQRTYQNYQKMLNKDAEGNILDDTQPCLARELARLNVPVNFYTQWYWKIDLHNLMHFLSLRADAHAQYEIRVYAEVMLDILKKWMPLTYEAFTDYRMKSVNLSEKAWAVIQQKLRGETAKQATSGLSPREWRELMETLEEGGAA